MKILCGDQVYLDAPSFWTVAPATNDDELRRRLIETYLLAWTQDPGFHTLLADGPNFFTSDDHDYWNNAPHWSVTAPVTLNEDLRCLWWKAAHDMYRAFQRPPPGTTRVDMAGLSILVADTRTERTSDQTAFMSDDDLDVVSEWAESLTSPGCLVVGQLLFTGKAGWMGRFSDWGLPDFRQYPGLLTALAKAKRSVIVLTGDVHYGRVAVCEIEPGVREIVEVVCLAAVPGRTDPQERLEEGPRPVSGGGCPRARSARDSHGGSLQVEQQPLRDDRALLAAGPVAGPACASGPGPRRSMGRSRSQPRKSVTGCHERCCLSAVLRRPRKNSRFKEIDANEAEGNVAWLTRACRPVKGLGSDGDVILLGGKSVADFRVRVAQSHMRDDLTPSYWSLVGIREGDNLLDRAAVAARAARPSART